MAKRKSNSISYKRYFLYSYLLRNLSRVMEIYESVNHTMEVNDDVHYLIECLHSLDAPGIPPHTFHLKIDVLIMLLSNFNHAKLCNGTKLQVKALYKHVIEVSIFTGVSLSRRGCFYFIDYFNTIKLPNLN